ncbi:unnamed protein product [Chrysoparadoxa australica]
MGDKEPEIAAKPSSTSALPEGALKIFEAGEGSATPLSSTPVPRGSTGLDLSPDTMAHVRKLSWTSQELEPTRIKCKVGIAVCEDIMCCVRSGTSATVSYVNALVKVSAAEAAYVLTVQDHQRQIESIRPNKKYLNELSVVPDCQQQRSYSCHLVSEWAARFAGADGEGSKLQYLDGMMYRCNASLRPVPIKVTSRVTEAGGESSKIVKVAIQIIANSTNPAPLSSLMVHATLPTFGTAAGDAAPVMKPGGQWSSEHRVMSWRLADLTPGGRCQVEAQVELSENITGPLPARVAVKVISQSPGVKVSGVSFDVSEPPKSLASPPGPGKAALVEFTTTVIERCRMQFVVEA